MNAVFENAANTFERTNSSVKIYDNGQPNLFELFLERLKQCHAVEMVPFQQYMLPIQELSHGFWESVHEFEVKLISSQEACTSFDMNCSAH